MQPEPAIRGASEEAIANLDFATIIFEEYTRGLI